MVGLRYRQNIVNPSQSTLRKLREQKMRSMKPKTKRLQNVAGVMRNQRRGLRGSIGNILPTRAPGKY